MKYPCIFSELNLIERKSIPKDFKSQWNTRYIILREVYEITMKGIQGNQKENREYWKNMDKSIRANRS